MMSNIHRHKKYKDLHMKLIENIVSLKVDVDQLMPIIAMILCEVDYADRTAVILFDKELTTGYIKTGFQVVRDSFKSDQGICIHLNKYPEILKVIQTGRMLQLNSQEEILEYLPTAEIKDEQGNQLYILSSILISPILINDKVTGIIRIDKSIEHNFFTEDDISFFRIISRHLSTVLELEEIKRIEKKQSFIQNILTSMQSMLIVADPDEKIKIVNRATLETLGYKENELIGKDIKTIIDIETIDFLEHKGILKEKEKAIAAKDGTKIPVLLSGSIMWDLQYYVEGLICVAQDITKQKELELQLIEAQRMEAIGSLTGEIAHDFNSILTVIQGYSEHILRIVTDPEISANIKILNDTAEKGSQLTKQLLAFSRRQILNPRVLDLNDKIRDLLKMTDRILGKHIQLEIKLADDLHKIKADPIQIDQVIMNLIINARDAMPSQGGKVTISTKNIRLNKLAKTAIPGAREGDFLKFSIRDTGSGIKPKIIKQIFEPFYTTKGESKGTGLGLSVVHGIITQHNGWINAYSKEGKGTLFTIYLPITTEGQPESKIGLTEIPESAKGRGQTIFYIEDEIQIMNVTSRILEKNGYKIIKTANPREALSIFKNNRDEIAMALIDIALPEISGYDLSKRLLKEEPGLPVLLYSSYIQESFQMERFKKEGYEFLQKPFTMIQLLDAVRQTLNKK